MKQTVIFPSFKLNKPGVWYFTTNKIEDFKKGRPCKGFGQIKYPEGSIYTGDIYFDGIHFNKLGYGQQDFTYSSLGAIDNNIHEKIYKYVGRFDYRKTDWIYGNGILYFRDKDNNPSHFIKGFFKGLNKQKEYIGEFDYSNLLDGYSKDMEFYYSARQALFENEKLNINKINKFKNLFIGDSYFEFWHYKEFSEKNFYQVFDNSLNLGLGGSTFSDWFYFVEQLKDLSEPENIIINLGFNDLHSSLSAKTVYRDFLTLVKLCRKYFPNSNYYVLNVVHAPLFESNYEEEMKYNKLLSDNAYKHNVIVLDNYNNILNGQNEENCFASDLVHLNNNGYILMYDLIKNEVKI